MRIDVRFGLKILLLVIFVCASSCERNRKPAVSPLSLQIGYSRLRISVAVFVAQERGIFKKHGLTVQLKEYNTAQPLIQALVEGRVPIAGYSALPITYNGILRSGTKLFFLTTIVEDQQHRISYLLRRKTPEGQEPTISSIQDLRGKRIGILPTIAYKTWFEVILKANGVNPEEVIILQIAPKLQPSMLLSGGVDGLFTNDPGATAAIIEAGAELITEDVEVPKVMGEPFAFGSFNVREDWASAHPDLFRRLIAAINEAVIFVNANPDEAKLSMKPYLPEMFKSHVEQYPDARYLTTAQSSEKTFQQLADRYLELGIMPASLDLKGMVVHGP